MKQRKIPDLTAMRRIQVLESYVAALLHELEDIRKVMTMLVNTTYKRQGKASRIKTDK